MLYTLWISGICVGYQEKWGLERIKKILQMKTNSTSRNAFRICNNSLGERFETRNS
ncbi:unnamed protein product [Larinioides sclopetarius]|uniref:Uncharacterized protein n=1 Tax=Larinioides sclopetarius TaxID=280406 RepID=A0AAV1YTA8_9ARAC